MTKIIRSGLAAGLLALAMSANAGLFNVPSGEYGLDKSHGYITVSYSHLGFSSPQVGFQDFDVKLNLDADDPEDSQLHVIIDAASVTTRVAEFDGHLNGDNFFDTENHPTITFHSTGIESTGDDTFAVHGDLTIKGITKPVTLDAVINKADNHPMRKIPTVGVTATGKVLRSEWDMARAVPYVSDEVTLYISVELPLKADD